jgi:hypothetical protein
MKIEILCKACPTCAKLYDNAVLAVKELKIGANTYIEKVEDSNRWGSYGVVKTPAFALDGEVKFSGRPLSYPDLKKLIEEAAAAE